MGNCQILVEEDEVNKIDEIVRYRTALDTTILAPVQLFSVKCLKQAVSKPFSALVKLIRTEKVRRSSKRDILYFVGLSNLKI